MASILKPLVGLSSHHLQNTKDFIQQLKEVKLQQDETIISYDVKALFTSVPIQPVLNTIKNKLENDQQLQQRTSMSVSHVTSLLEYCLRSTLLCIPGWILWTVGGGSHGVTTKPHHCKHIHGAVWDQSPQHSTQPPTLWKGLLMTPLLSSKHHTKGSSSIILIH